MKKATTKGMFRTLATRSVLAALPVAMVSAYATNMIVPTPPRMAAYEFQQVAEITVSPSTVGIAASPLYGQTKAAIDAQLDEMQALGIENIRVFVPWASMEFFGPTDPDDPITGAAWAAFDLVMQSAAEHNMGVMAEINSTPPYAVTEGGFGTGTPDPEMFATFLGKLVEEYGSTISAYEIWNEPNAVLFSNPIDPAAYAELLKAAYEVVKPTDPNAVVSDRTATVIAGALGHVFTTGFTMDPVEFVQAMLVADPNVLSYFDALSYHPYDETLPFTAGNVDPNSGGFASDTAFNQLKDLMALIGPTKKVWLTEFGVPTYTYTQTNPWTGQLETVTVTQEQQEALIRNLVSNWGDANYWNSIGQSALYNQLGPIFLYTGRDPLTGSPLPDDNYGLWTSTGAEKLVISQFLRQWFIDHPQNGTGGPTDPPDPDPLQAALQVLAQQIAQALSNALAQAFAQTIGQQIADAIVNAIAQALAGLGQTPAPAAAPLSLRTASVESDEAAALAAETDSETAAATATSATEEAKDADAAGAATEPAAAATEAAAEATAEPAAEATVTEPATPATEPETVTETPAATDTATTPASTPTESTSTEKPTETDTKSAEPEKKSDESDKKSDDSDKKSDKKSDDSDKKSGEAKSNDSEGKSKGDGGQRHRKHGSGEDLKVKAAAEGADGEGGAEE